MGIGPDLLLPWSSRAWAEGPRSWEQDRSYTGVLSEVRQMFGKKDSGNAHPKLKCQAEGCDFACSDCQTLQKHANKKHRGVPIRCSVPGCDFSCPDYYTLEKHMSWRHAGEKEALVTPAGQERTPLSPGELTSPLEPV